MLSVILMLTTRKLAIEYTQKKIKKEFKHFTTKKLTKHKKRRQKVRDQKAIGHIKSKEQNDRNKSLLISSNLNANGLNSPIKRQVG